MKRYLLLILLLIAGDKAWGQIRIYGDSYYKLTISGSPDYSKIYKKGIIGIKRDPSVYYPEYYSFSYSVKDLNLIYNDGSKQNIGFDKYYTSVKEKIYIYTSFNKIPSIEINYYYNQYCVTDVLDIAYNETLLDKQTSCEMRSNKYIINNYDNCLKFTTSHYSDDKENEYLTIQTFPVYRIIFNATENNTLESDRKLTIILPDNLEARDYIWKYSIAGSAPTLFPEKYNYKHALDIPAKDFVDEKNFGKPISAWVESPCGGHRSNVYTFIVYPAGPRILSATPTNPKCADGAGSVTLTFDRTLLPGENTVRFFHKNNDRDKELNLEQKINNALTQQLKEGTTVIYDNLTPGNHSIRITTQYKGQATYSDGAQRKIFTITPPAPVTFTSTGQNVYCAGGSDGHIQIIAAGGTPPYQYTSDDGATWQEFNGKGGTTRIPNLAAGTYKIKVRDANLCVAKEKGAEKEAHVKIGQPEIPIALSQPDIRQPKGYGLSDGYIALTLTGGTPKPDGSYHYEWRKDSPDGALLTDVSTNTTDGFALRLNNVSAGNYYLTLKDNNYDDAVSERQACGIIAREITVSQPDPLVAEIKTAKNISCNPNNDYNAKNDHNVNDVPDEAEDGILTASVQGGVKDYAYQWQQEIKGVFQNIADATDSRAPNLTQGKYRVLITDANGITTSAEGQLNFPPELKIHLNTKDLLCNNVPAGSATVVAAGGTGAYRYLWNTQDKKPEINTLSAGAYFVVVTDDNHCAVNAKITLTEPEPLRIKDLSIRNPRRPGAADGSIHIQPEGGKGAYQIKWSDGKSAAHITNLTQGLYTVTLTDDNGCHSSKQYLLTDPDKIKVDLGPDLTLCLGDTKTFNVTVNDPDVSYLWTDNTGNTIASEPVVTLSNAGTYTVTISHPSGNFSSDTITITTSQQILKPEFLITTHAYTDRSVTLVNTSTIPPEKTQWILPQDKTIQTISQSDDFIELKFAQPGAYTIGLKGIQGACEKTFFKNITVEENTQGITPTPAALSNIQDFIIAPNPNRGLYNVTIKLRNPAPIRLRIINMNGYQLHNPLRRAEAKEFNIPFNLSLPTGVYLIILESNAETMVKKMIVL